MGLFSNIRDLGVINGIWISAEEAKIERRIRKEEAEKKEEEKLRIAEENLRIAKDNYRKKKSENQK